MNENVNWAIGNADQCARDHAICDGAEVVARVTGRGYPTGLGWHERSAEMAQFIVRACNSHHDLVAVVKDLAFSGKPLTEMVETHGPPSPRQRPHRFDATVIYQREVSFSLGHTPFQSQPHQGRPCHSLLGPAFPSLVIIEDQQHAAITASSVPKGQ